MLSNNLLRKNARYHLGGSVLSNLWVLITVACVLVSLLNSFLSLTVLGILVASGPISYGLSRLVYNAIIRDSVDFSDLFSGFSECFQQSFLLYIVQYLRVFLWSLLFIIPGIVQSYSYSMAFFLQQRTKRGWRECLDKSQRYMDGYKWQLFCLDVSFIGWYFLGTLFFGIGTFFVYTYHTTARTEFFMARLGEGVVVSDDYYEEVDAEEVIVEEVSKSHRPVDPFESVPPMDDVFGEEYKDYGEDSSTQQNNTIGKDDNSF